MNKENKKDFRISLGLLAAFLLWTGMVCLVDVQQIGPRGSAVGLAAINRLFHNFTGIHMSVYVITDWLSLVPLMVVLGFGVLGLAQWIRRKHLFLVDYSILVLGGFYAVVAAVFALFEVAAVNYRPVLIDGVLEASYPSSTTMLVLCVMPTAWMQLKARIQSRILSRCAAAAIAGFTGFMVIGRLISGVHWLSDIIAGILLSAGLVLLYRAVIRLKPGSR